MKNIFVHPSADVSTEAKIGDNTRIWNQAQVREGACVGENCIIGKDVYIDFGVCVGNNVKIQNGSYLYHGTVVENGVFIGPGVIFANDKFPRSINTNGSLKTNSDWTEGKILIKQGVSLGAGSIILPNVTIGAYAMVGAGAVVTRNVPGHGLVIGNPAMLVGFVCFCGRRLTDKTHSDDEMILFCNECKRDLRIPERTRRLIK